jgi:hypothetical protein
MRRSFQCDNKRCDTHVIRPQGESVARNHPGRQPQDDRLLTGPRVHVIALLVAIKAAGAVSAPAQGPSPPGVSVHPIPATDTPVIVDGILDDPAWADAWRTELPYEVQPGDNADAPVRTEVLLTHDDRHLFVAFRAHDPDPRQIRAHLCDRDEAWSDDWVGVVLDTFNDERRNYLLLVNPLGVQMDNIEAWSNGDTAWDGIWTSAARMTDWGWTAELKIPFATLRFQRSEGPQVWGFDAIRGYPRNIFRQMGAFPRDRDNNCYLCQAIKIEGFAGVTPGRNLEIVPTLTSARTDQREDFPDGPLEQGAGEIEAGLTVRWGITPNLTLSGTLNPDYSQVEADALQLDINEPFELFFPEKRPFFMEAADFFETPLNTVYTRMMREPDWGAKISGKEGGHTIGSYVVQDQITNIVFPGSQESDSDSFEFENTSMVARYKRDLGARYTLGAIYTGREGDSYFNRVAGVDGDLRLSPKDRVLFQMLGSSTQYPDEVAEEYDQPLGEFDDLAAELLYLHTTRNWEWWAQYRDIGADYRADLGFMPKVDFRHTEAGFGHTWLPDGATWYSELELLTKVSFSEDQEGNLLEDELAVMFNYQGPLQSHSFIRPSRKREGYDGEEFDLNEVSLHTCLNPNRNTHAWLNLILGDQIDYANTRAGNRVQVTAGFWYRIGRHLYLEASDTHETMDVDPGWLYRANIAQMETAWQFNPRTFVRGILQYTDYNYNLDLYLDPEDLDDEERHLFTQFLFSYKVNPQTVIFVGYSDNSYAYNGAGLTQGDRTFFVKLGYAWLL